MDVYYRIYGDGCILGRAREEQSFPVARATFAFVLLPGDVCARRACQAPVDVFQS